jgi:translation initiation factor IF-3
MRINDAIKAPRVRLIVSNGDQAGIVPTREAKTLAVEEGLDLVEISPTSDPPVCKIMNYGKYKFQQTKKLKDAKSKQKQVLVKEVKFKPRIDEHDYQFKVKHIKRFIEHGDKVRVFVQFRGREMTHREIGLRILERIMTEMDELVSVEKRPGMEGHHMAMYLVGKDSVTKSKPK